MNTFELMQGNILRDKLTGAYLRVEEIKKDLVGYEVVDRTKYPLPKGWQAEPVLLNRDVMKMLGFEMSIVNGHTEYTLKVDGDEDKDLIMFALTPYSLPYIPSMPHIKYLHQVQNLVTMMANFHIKIKFYE